MSSEQDIARFIETQIKNYPGISGAKLGALATAQFPGVNFRIQFNGLKSFVKQFCPPEIEIMVGGPGGDDAYRCTTAPSADQEGATVSPVSEVTETPWSAFASSDSPNTLRLNRESGELDVVPSSMRPAVAPWIDVPKVSTEEYRQIASSFLSQIADVDRYHFSALLHLPDFWDRWFAETRAFSGGKYLRAWVSFRFHKLCETFLGRLTEAGVSSDAALKYLERLKQSKKSKKELRRDHSMEFGDEQSTLRRIATAAIKEMTDEDLRRVWLPLGVISDALRRSEH